MKLISFIFYRLVSSTTLVVSRKNNYDFSPSSKETNPSPTKNKPMIFRAQDELKLLVGELGTNVAHITKYLPAGFLSPATWELIAGYISPVVNLENILTFYEKDPTLDMKLKIKVGPFQVEIVTCAVVEEDGKHCRLVVEQNFHLTVSLPPSAAELEMF